MADTKEHAYELINRLPTTQLSAVEHGFNRPTASLAIANAPINDEPLTAEEEKALGEAREWLRITRAFPTSRSWLNSGSPRKKSS